MAKNKTSKFGLDDGLFTNADNTPVREEAPQKKAKKEPSVTDFTSLFSVPGGEPRPLGSTQGKKGQKAKRINMAFSDSVHAYIAYESRRRGLSITKFVNQVLEEYMNSPQGHID